ncbi:transcriptional regulator [Campylobacter coli]|nr:transcriptional regulator [Campylobacter coli]
MAEEKENIVKKTCKELGLTYRQLGELIGFGEEAISKAARTENISTQMQKALDLYLENIDLKEKLKEMDNLKNTLKTLLDLK